MSESLRFYVLGPQRAWYGDREIDLGPGKQRAVLGVLLLAPGRPVPISQIVDAVWPDEQPVNGPNVVQKYVAGLRRVLEPHRSPRSPGRVLTLTDAGYVLRVTPEAVDALRFERGVQRARRELTEGRPAEAAALLRETLGLWHGDPFTGFTGSVFESARQRLVETRATALETWAELELRAGRDGELVGRLVELVAEFPVRERLRHLLMLALYRGGRQAEALAAYRDLDTMLRQEYGLEPGEALRDLHRRILNADPMLGAPVDVPTHPPAPPAPSAVPTVPAASTVGAGPVATGQAASAPAGTVVAVPDRPPAGADTTGRSAPHPATPPPYAAASLGHRTTGLLIAPSPPTWLSHLGTAVNALLVAFSLGALTWFSITFYAVRRQSRWLGLSAVGYLVAGGVAFGTITRENPSGATSWMDGIAMVLLALIWPGGFGHVLVLNRRIGVLLGTPSGLADPVEIDRRARRYQARQLLHLYPVARHDLRIGRPDLPRGFDDGGLVDVNAVSAAVIEALPGLTTEQGRQIVAARAAGGPYVSLEELSVRCHLPLDRVELLRDILVFLPPPGPPGPSVTLAPPPTRLPTGDAGRKAG